MKTVVMPRDPRTDHLMEAFKLDAAAYGHTLAEHLPVYMMNLVALLSRRLDDLDGGPEPECELCGKPLSEAQNGPCDGPF